MSWFNQASLSSFAKSALSTAQKSIDKVLDIQDDEAGDGKVAGSSAALSAGSDTRSADRGKTDSCSLPSKSSSRASLDNDSFFSEYLMAGSDKPSGASIKPKKIHIPPKRIPPLEKLGGEAKGASDVKPARLPSSGKNVKSKSKMLREDSDDSDERGEETKAVKLAKKLHLGQKKMESKEGKREPVKQPVAPPSDQSPVFPEQKGSTTCEELEKEPQIHLETQGLKLEDSAIDPEIVKSTESFLLVRSDDTKELAESDDKVTSGYQACSIDSSNSTSTGTVEPDEKEQVTEVNIPQRQKGSDLDAKSESENTDEQTSVKSDSDFVVINEHTASEQSSVYLYDTRESPENESPKHYSSSSNGKRSPTDSDFSIISEGRFSDMPEAGHAGCQAADVGNIMEQASIALLQRVSPSYSADVESEDQDDKTGPSLCTEERTQSSSEEENVREEQNSTPTPSEKELSQTQVDQQKVRQSPSATEEENVDRQASATDKDEDNSAVQPEKLLKKLAEMAQVMQARETQILHLSQQNGELQESITGLKKQVRDTEEARKNDSHDLNELTEEFTQRLSAMEKKLQVANRERDQFMKHAHKMQKALTDLEKSDATGKLLTEKDEQIKELMMEGEKLSKQQLQNSNIIKKLRSKEKETERLLKTQKEQLDEAEARVSQLENVLDGKEDVEKKQKDAIKTLNTAVERQEKELASLRGELEESREKVRSTQHALDGSYKEIAELHRSIAAKQSMVQETALSAEMNAKEELKLALERSQLEARRQHEGLLLQVNDLQLSLNRADQQSARKEESFRQEIADLQQRLQEGEARNQELSQSVTATTRPLLRQIENLQSTFNVQSSSWEQVERNLTERLTDAQAQLAVSTERERAAQEACLEASSKVAAMESQLAILRQEKSRLSALLEVEKARIESVEENRMRDFHHQEKQLQSYLKTIEEAHREKASLEKQLQLEKMRLESEQKKLTIAQESLEEKERLLQEETTGSRSPVSRSSTPSHTELRPVFATNPSQGEILERTISSSLTSSVYDSVLTGSIASIIESLQSQLKQREGEIAQLQSEIVQLERTRSSMAEEIVRLTNQMERLESEANMLPDLRIQLKDLQHRYNAVLQMYGEKAEVVEELRLDLQDVKEMYRQQIEDLIRGSQ